MLDYTTIEVHAPVSDVLNVLLRMRRTEQATRVGEISRLTIGRATATVFWSEAVQSTVIHVKDPHRTSAATAACARLMAKLPECVAKFETRSASLVP